MAEYALGYMLAHELQIIERLKYQAKHEWFDEDTGNLRGKNLGVMGTGSIGQAIALKAGLMGMSVTGLSRSGEGASPFSKVYAGDRLAEFLAGLDYLVSVLPDTAESTGLLGARAFHILPDHAVLINVGRGNVIHDDALINALENGDIGGAVLDVFNQEPLPENHPFWDTPGLLITGHVAARSYPEDLAAIFLRNYAAYQNEEPLNYLLDPDRGY